MKRQTDVWQLLLQKTSSLLIIGGMLILLAMLAYSLINHWTAS